MKKSSVFLFLLLSNALVLFLFGQMLYVKAYLIYTGMASIREASGLIIGLFPFVLSFFYLLYTTIRSFKKHNKGDREQNILDRDAITSSDEE